MTLIDLSISKPKKELLQRNFRYKNAACFMNKYLKLTFIASLGSAVKTRYRRPERTKLKQSSAFPAKAVRPEVIAERTKGSNSVEFIV